MNHIPDKMILMGGPVKVAAVVTGSMRILITPTPHTDPAFDGVSVQVESFIPDGTTDKVFYPYRKPTTKHNEPVEREFVPHMGEWLKWAEEHPEELMPVIKAAMAVEQDYSNTGSSERDRLALKTVLAQWHGIRSLAGHWAEHPTFTSEMWRDEAHADHTRESYDAWVVNQIEQDFWENN